MLAFGATANGASEDHARFAAARQYWDQNPLSSVPLYDAANSVGAAASAPAYTTSPNINPTAWAMRTVPTEVVVGHAAVAPTMPMASMMQPMVQPGEAQTVDMTIQIAQRFGYSPALDLYLNGVPTPSFDVGTLAPTLPPPSGTSPGYAPAVYGYGSGVGMLRQPLAHYAPPTPPIRPHRPLPPVMPEADEYNPLTPSSPGYVGDLVNTPRASFASPQELSPASSPDSAFVDAPVVKRKRAPRRSAAVAPAAPSSDATYAAAKKRSQPRKRPAKKALPTPPSSRNSSAAPSTPRKAGVLPVITSTIPIEELKLSMRSHNCKTTRPPLTLPLTLTHAEEAPLPPTRNQTPSHLTHIVEATQTRKRKAGACDVSKGSLTRKRKADDALDDSSMGSDEPEKNTRKVLMKYGFFYEKWDAQIIDLCETLRRVPAKEEEDGMHRCRMILDGIPCEAEFPRGPEVHRHEETHMGTKIVCHGCLGIYSRLDSWTRHHIKGACERARTKKSKNRYSFVSFLCPVFRLRQ